MPIDATVFLVKLKNFAKICDGTGYKGDFEVEWIDQNDKEDCNVYEYINY